MKKIKLFILVLVAMVAIIGCSNDKDGNDNTDSDVNNNANNNQQIENNDQDDANESKANSGEMKLGETASVDDGINQYEITPKSVEIFTERNGISTSNDDEVFALIDYTVKSTDRKSTRLNSSHVAISYAVFCLKKKKKEKIEQVFK